MMQAQSKSYTSYTDVTNSDRSAQENAKERIQKRARKSRSQNDANFLHILSGVIGTSVFVLVMTVIGLVYLLPSPDFYAILSLGVIIVYQCADGRVFAAAMDALSKEIRKFRSLRRKRFLRTQRDSDSGAEQQAKEKKTQRVHIPHSIKLGLAVSALISICLIFSVPLGAMWWVPEPLVGIFTVMWLVICGEVFNYLFARIQSAQSKSKCVDYTIGSSILRKSAGVSRRFKAIVYSVLVIGLILFIKSWAGMAILPSYCVWHVFNFITSDLFYWTNLFYYSGAVLTAFMLFKKDWNKVRIHIDSLLEIYTTQFGKICKRSWTFGKKIAIVPVLGAIASILFFALSWIPLIVCLPLASTCVYLTLLSFTAGYQKFIRILGWMISRWARKNLHTVRYRGKVAYQYWNHERRVALTAACLIVFCNITPILIECLWNPAYEKYLRSNQHANDLLSADSAEMNSWGGASWLFLEKEGSNPVVSEDNDWQSYYYNGRLTWGRVFNGEGPANLIIDIEGILAINVTLVHPDENLFRLNYTAVLGRNVFPIYTGDKTMNWHLEIADVDKSYVTRIVVSPLWSAKWDTLQIEWSQDHVWDNILDEQDQHLGTSYYHPVNIPFYAYDMVTILIKPQTSAHNSLYLEVDGELVQSLHPTENPVGYNPPTYPIYPYITTDSLIEDKGSFAYEYSLRLDDIDWNATSPGQHLLTFAIAKDYSTQLWSPENVTVTYAIIAHGDWDADTIDNIVEENYYYNELRGCEIPDSFGYFSVFPESESTDLFESNWSYAEFDFNYIGFGESYLYIDIITNTSVFTNFTVDSTSICHGSMSGLELNFTESSWYSIFTEMLLSPGQHKVGFLYHTSSVNPARSLMFWINNFPISILPGESIYLSQGNIDSDDDGLPDSVDNSPNVSWVADASDVFRLVANTEENTDTEINIQVSTPENDLYKLTHNNSGVFYEWNDESIVMIDPVFRIFSDLYATDSYTSQNLTSIAPSQVQYYFLMNMEDELFIYPILNQITTLSAFSDYWDKEVALFDMRNPDALAYYDFTAFGDSIVSDWDENGVPDNSIMDTWGITPQSWFDDYVDYWGSMQSGAWYDWVSPEEHLNHQEVIQREYLDYVGKRVGANSLEGNIIEMTRTDESFKASIMIPANNSIKDDGILDIKGELLWKVMDLNILANTIFESDKSIINSTRRHYITVDSIDITTGAFILKNATYDYIDGDWEEVNSEIFSFNLMNSTIVFPESYEVEDAIRFNEFYYHENVFPYQGGPPGYYINEYGDDSYSDWKGYSDDSELFGTIDDDILGMKFGPYHSVIDLTDIILPPGTKICTQGTPSLLTFYPWEEEVITIQSIQKLEHEQVQYMLGAPDNATEREIMNTVIKNPALWDLQSSAFNPAMGGIDINDDIYGVNKVIKTTSQFNLMRDSMNDFMAETTIGMGWGQAIYPCDSIDFGAWNEYNTYYKIDTNLSVSNNGYGEYLQIDRFGMQDSVLHLGRSSNTFSSTIGNNITKKFTSGYVSFDVQIDNFNKAYDGEQGFDEYSIEFRLSDSSYPGYTAFKLCADDENQWTSRDGFNIEHSTDAPIGEWNHFTIFFNTITHTVDLYVNDRFVGQYFIDTDFAGANSFQFVADNVIAHLDNIRMPGWTQMGLQPAVLLTNSRYDNADLLKYYFVNKFAGTYTGEFFMMNNTMFHLNYNPSRDQWQLYYPDSDFVLTDDFSNIPFDNVTYSFNEEWMQNKQIPDYFTCNYIYDENDPYDVQTGVRYGNLVLTSYESINPTATTYINPIKSGTVQISLNLTNIDEFFDDGTKILASLNMRNFSINEEGELVVVDLTKALQIGSVNGVLSYRNTAVTQSWTSMSIPVAEDTPYVITIQIYNSTTPNVGYLFNITVVYGQTTVKCNGNTLTFAEGNGFGSIYFKSDATYMLSIDNITISSMLAMFNPPSSYWEYESENKIVVSEYILDVNNTIHNPFLILANGTASRTLNHPLTSGLVEFSLGVSEDEFTGEFKGEVALTCGEEKDHYINITTHEGYWNIILPDGDYENLGVEITPYEMIHVRILFGASSLYGHTGRGSVSVWINDFYVDTYLRTADPYLDPVTDIQIHADEDQEVLFDNLIVTDIPDVQADDLYFDYQFGGYCHDHIPSNFTLWGQDYNISLYWSSVFATANGTEFAYINELNQGVVVPNCTLEVQWISEVWAGGFTVPIPQYKNSLGQWETAKRILDIQYANTSTVNSIDYINIYDISSHNARIMFVNQTSNRLVINDYTPYMDWLCEDRFSPQFNAFKPYNDTFNSEYLLSDLVIKVPKVTGGYDVLSSITNISYYLNGVQQTGGNGNICTSIYAELPVGTLILCRVDPNGFADVFTERIVNLIDNAPSPIKFDFRYGSDVVVNSFDSLWLCTNVTDTEEFFSAPDFTESGILYSIVQIEDYSEAEGIFNIPNLIISDFPVSIGVSSSTVKNFSGSELLSMSGVQVQYASSFSSLVHIAPSESGGINLEIIDPADIDRSAFIEYYSENIFAFDYDRTGFSHSDRLRFGLLDFQETVADFNSNWRDKPLGDREWMRGTKGYIDYNFDKFDEALRKNMLELGYAEDMIAKTLEELHTAIIEIDTIEQQINAVFYKFFYGKACYRLTPDNSNLFDTLILSGKGKDLETFKTGKSQMRFRNFDNEEKQIISFEKSSLESSRIKIGDFEISVYFTDCGFSYIGEVSSEHKFLGSILNKIGATSSYFYLQQIYRDFGRFINGKRIPFGKTVITDSKYRIDYDLILGFNEVILTDSEIHHMSGILEGFMAFIQSFGIQDPNLSLQTLGSLYNLFVSQYGGLIRLGSISHRDLFYQIMGQAGHEAFCDPHVDEFFENAKKGLSNNADEVYDRIREVLTGVTDRYPHGYWLKNAGSKDWWIRDRTGKGTFDDALKNIQKLMKDPEMEVILKVLKAEIGLSGALTKEDAILFFLIFRSHSELVRLSETGEFRTFYWKAICDVKIINKDTYEWTFKFADGKTLTEAVTSKFYEMKIDPAHTGDYIFTLTDYAKQQVEAVEALKSKITFARIQEWIIKRFQAQDNFLKTIKVLVSPFRKLGEFLEIMKLRATEFVMSKYKDFYFKETISVLGKLGLTHKSITSLVNFKNAFEELSVILKTKYNKLSGILTSIENFKKKVAVPVEPVVADINAHLPATAAHNAVEAAQFDVIVDDNRRFTVDDIPDSQRTPTWFIDLLESEGSQIFSELRELEGLALDGSVIGGQRVPSPSTIDLKYRQITCKGHSTDYSFSETYPEDFMQFGGGGGGSGEILAYKPQKNAVSPIAEVAADAIKSKQVIKPKLIKTKLADWAGSDWAQSLAQSYREGLFMHRLANDLISGIEDVSTAKILWQAVMQGGNGMSFSDLVEYLNVQSGGQLQLGYSRMKQIISRLDNFYDNIDQRILRLMVGDDFEGMDLAARKAFVKKVKSDLEGDSIYSKGGIMQDARTMPRKAKVETVFEIIDILVEIITFAMQQAELDRLVREGKMSEAEYVFQTIINTAQFVIGLVIDIIQLYCAWTMTEACSWIPVVNIIMFIYMIATYVYAWRFSPIYSQIENFRISEAGSNRYKTKYGSYRYGDSIRIQETYRNLDFLNLRTHYDHIAARTSSMPMNITPISPYYSGYPYYCQMPLLPETREDSFVSTSDWIQPDIVWWHDFTLDVSLNNVSANEELTVVHHYGYQNLYGINNPQDYVFDSKMDLGAVVETNLNGFVANMKTSCNLSLDSDGDGIPCYEEILNGSNIHNFDSDGDKLSDSDEIDIYHTNPNSIDTDSDLLTDWEEVFEYNSDPNISDCDDDGVMDGDEIILNSNIHANDTDLDGLSDLWEQVLGTNPNASDSDDDGLSDFTELRLNYDPMDADSPATAIAQTGFIGTEGLGFFKGQNTFSQYSSGTDPWSTSGSYGQAFVSLVPYKYKWLYPVNNSFHFSSEFASYTPHYYSYVFNNSAGRAFYPSTSLGSDWQLEFYCAPMDNSFTTTIALSNYEEFRFRFNAANDKFEYRWGFHDWTNISTSQTITNWTVWKVDWDLSDKELTWSIDLDSDESIDIQFELNASNCYWLQPALNYQFLSRVAFESEGTSVSAIDSVSIWTPMEEWNYNGYSKGDLYDVISFPDVYAWADTTSSKIRCEWAQIEGASMVFAYDDASFSGFESPDLLFAGPFSGATGTLSIPSDGNWYIKPIVVMEDYYIPLGEAFPVEFTTYRSTFDFTNDTIGQAPDLFTASGTATVEQTRDVYKWYTNEPYTSYYKYCQLNDTSASSKSAIEKDVTRFISDNDFIEFWWATSNNSFTSEFILTNSIDQALVTLSINDGYFWLSPGGTPYNTTEVCESEVWYHIRIVLSRSGAFQLYINSKFVDTFTISMSAEKNVKKIKFATINADLNYTTAIRGIGLSWLGNYEKFENWPQMKDIDMVDELAGFSQSLSLQLAENYTHHMTTGESYKDFLFLNDTTILTNTGKVVDISKEESYVTSTIHSWRQAMLFEGKLYVMADTKFEDFYPRMIPYYNPYPPHEVLFEYEEEYQPEGLHIYDISDPAHPEVVGEPFSWWFPTYPYWRAAPYGPFDICRNGSQILAFIATPEYLWNGHKNKYGGYSENNNCTYSYFLYDVTDPANIANPNHVNHTQVGLNVYHFDPEWESVWSYGATYGESVKDVKIRMKDGDLVFYVITRHREFLTGQGWQDNLVLFTFIADTRYQDWLCVRYNNPPQFGYYEMSRSVICDTSGPNDELYLTTYGYYLYPNPSWPYNILSYGLNRIPIRATISLPSDQFSDKVVVQLVGELPNRDPSMGRDPTETRIIDIFKPEQTFKLGIAGGLSNSVMQNTTSLNIEDINDMLIAESSNTIRVYNSTNPMSPDPNSAFEVTASSTTVASKLKWRDGGLWNVRTLYQSGQYITNITEYTFQYPMDYESWTASNAITTVDYQGRLQAAKLLGGQQMSRTLENAHYGVLSFRINSGATTNAFIKFHTANDTENKYIQLNLVGQNLSTAFNNQYLQLSSGWNEITLSYDPEGAIVSLGSSSITLNVTQSGWFNNVTFACNANSGALYLDAFHHRAIVSDSDGDGIVDATEINRYGTDPFRADSDFDTIPDGYEIAYGLNPMEYNDAFLDLDNDGCLNIYEWGNGTKPNDWDTDRDGESDYSEIMNNRNPLIYGDADSDGDGILNDVELQDHTNPWDADTDHDLANDGIEKQVETSPILQDTDGDAMWDGWELQYGLDPTDPDDAEINCDGDKISNVNEWYQGTNPVVSPDADHDNIPDDWRYYWEESCDYGDPLGTNTSDHDADGVTNIQEFQGLWNGSTTWGTNPHWSNVNGSWGVGLSEDYATFYDFAYSESGANLDLDLDKLTNSMEWKARFNGTAASMHPRDAGSLSYNLGRDWASYYYITRTQANSDADFDGDKLRNWMEYRGKADAFSVSTRLNPRDASVKTPSFDYYYPDGTKVTRQWYADWWTYYTNATHVLTNSSDIDGDKVLDWQELYGRYDYTSLTQSVWGLDPKNKNYSATIGMSKDWAAYYNIEWSVNGGNADADSDGVKNKDEYTANSNPRMSDTDGDSLPDKYEIKWGLQAYNRLGAHGKDGDYDQDGISNYKEYRFDTTNLAMNPCSINTDGDAKNDTVEYYLYWQFSNGIRHSDTSRVSPISSSSSNIICYSTDATSASTAFTPYVYGSGSYLSASLTDDGNYGWFWAYGTSQLYCYFEGWSVSWINNATIRQYVSDVKIWYRICPYTTDKARQGLSDFKITVTTDGVSESMWIYQGALTYEQRSTWILDSKFTTSTTRNKVRSGEYLDKVRFDLTVIWYWAASGQICTNWVDVMYAF